MKIVANVIFDNDSWMAELISDNAEQRAFTAAAMNTLQCKFSSLYFADYLLTRWIKIRFRHGFRWFGSNKFISPMVRHV